MRKDNMKTFNARFVGRLRTAIGSFYWITDTVTGDNEDEAVTKLYNTYDHIRFLTLTENR